MVKTCPRCHSKVCLACGEPVSADHEKHVTTRDDPLFHCSNLQGIILGVGLSMLEQVFNDQNLEQADNSIEPPTRNIKRRKTETSTEDEDAVYYAGMQGKRARGGTGYDGDVTEDVRLVNELIMFYIHLKTSCQNTGQLKALAAQRVKDEKIGKLLCAIRVYLPNLNREGGGRTSDYLVHPTALAHLRRRFNYVCSNLLRNDSLADMSERSILYFELLEWLEVKSYWHISVFGITNDCHA